MGMTKKMTTIINSKTMTYRTPTTISPTTATNMRTSSPLAFFYSLTFSTSPPIHDTPPSIPSPRTFASTYSLSPYSSTFPFCTFLAQTFSFQPKYPCTLLTLG